MLEEELELLLELESKLELLDDELESKADELESKEELKPDPPKPDPPELNPDPPEPNPAPLEPRLAKLVGGALLEEMGRLRKNHNWKGRQQGDTQPTEAVKTDVVLELEGK